MTMVTLTERVPSIHEISYAEGEPEVQLFSNQDQLSNFEMPDGSTMWVMNGLSDQGNAVYHFIKVLKSGEDERLIVEPRRLNPAAQMKFLPLQLCLLEKCNAVMARKMEAAQKEESDFLKQANAMLSDLTRDAIAYIDLQRKQMELVNDFQKQTKAFGETVIRFSSNVTSFGRSVDGLKSNVQSFGRSVDGLKSNVQSFGRSVDGLKSNVQSFGRSVDELKSNVSSLNRDANKLEGQVKETVQELKQLTIGSYRDGLQYVTTCNNGIVDLDIQSIFNRFVPSVLQTSSNFSPGIQEEPTMLSRTDDGIRLTANSFNGSPPSSLSIESSRSKPVEPLQEAISEKPTGSPAVPSNSAVERDNDASQIPISLLANSQAAHAQTLPEEPSKVELSFKVQEVIVEKSDVSFLEEMLNGCSNLFEMIFRYLKSFLNPFSFQ